MNKISANKLQSAQRFIHPLERRVHLWARHESISITGMIKGNWIYICLFTENKDAVIKLSNN